MTEDWGSMKVCWSESGEGSCSLPLKTNTEMENRRTLNYRTMKHVTWEIDTTAEDVEKFLGKKKAKYIVLYVE